MIEALHRRDKFCAMVCGYSSKFSQFILTQIDW
jgi:hypothetical protein